MSSGMYYRGGSGGAAYSGGGGGAYYGRESSGRGAFHAHAEEKRKAGQMKQMAVAGGAVVLLVLVVVVVVLSRRGHLPASYVGECRDECGNADYLCGTICDKAMVGPFDKPDLRAACKRGCDRFGKAACASACASNDVGECQTAMQGRKATEFCVDESAEGSGGGDASHSEQKACEIGAGAVATTQWPCSVGVKTIGRILSEHKM